MAQPATIVETHASVAARLSGIDGLRNGGWPAGAPSLPPRFLRHCDEQTVVGVHAVLAAIARLGEPRPSFARHGVIAASCQAGRITAAQTLAQAMAGGGVTVSTHVVPQCSLHSPAGAVSVGLGMHGPNIGVSGGPEALAEGLFTAVSWLASAAAGAGGCDGVWLVATGWDEEPALDASGKPVTDPVCRAVAVCVARAECSAAHGDDRRGLDLELQPGAAAYDPCAFTSPLAEFAAALESPGARWSLRCPWGMEIRLRPVRASLVREAA